MSSDEFDQADFLIDRIYQAGVDPELWVQVAKDIQSAVGGHSINLVLQNRSKQRLNFALTSGVPEESLAFYESEMMPIDEMTQLFKTHPVGVAFSSDKVIRDNDMLDLEVTQRFYGKFGYHRFGTVVLHDDSDRLAWLSVVRSVKDETYSKNSIDLLQKLSPHLIRAFELNQRLLEVQCQNGLLDNALEQLGLGIIFLDSKGAVIELNDKARNMLDSKTFDIRSNVLYFSDKEVSRWFNQQFQAAVFQQVVSKQDSLNKIKTKASQISVQVRPYVDPQQRRSLLLRKPQVVVFISDDNEQKVLPDQILSRLYGLTKKENEVLNYIMDDCGTKDIAKALGISVDTVKFHIKNVFKKTETNSRVELVGKINRSINRLVL